MYETRFSHDIFSDEMRLFSRQRSDELFEFSFLQGVTTVLLAFFVALIVLFSSNLIAAAITFLSLVLVQYIFLGWRPNILFTTQLNMLGVFIFFYRV